MKNWTIFWRLFNNVILRESGDPISYFNPTGWCVDEAGAIWKSLKDAFGEDSIKTSTVSCEKHSIGSELLHLHLQKYKFSFRFKELATKLMTANTPSMYEQAVNNQQLY